MLAMILAAGSLATATKSFTFYASSLQTSRLIEVCNQPNEDLTEGMCTGYILGVWDGLSLSRELCPTPNNPVATLQAVAVTRKYLKDHPERWNESPVDLVYEALRTIFPACREK